MLISVICPVKNDKEGIEDTLSSLVEQEYDPYEIIVADAHSTDGTRQVIQEYQEEYDNIRLVDDDEGTISGGRNAGIAAAEGEVIAFIDSDMWVEDRWLAKLAERFSDEEILLGACDVQIVQTSDSFVSEYSLRTALPIEDFVENQNFAPGCCLVLRQEIFERYGTFDARMVASGDEEIIARLTRNHGIELHYFNDIVMYHPTRNTLGELRWKYFRTGIGYSQRDKHHAEYDWDDSFFTGDPPYRHISDWKTLSAKFKAGFLALYLFEVSMGLAGRLYQSSGLRDRLV